MRTSIRLSELVLNRRNPRRVKPEREAHRRLVASIRAYGLLQPLVVRPAVDDPKSFRVIAGQRRLAALREVHRGDGDETTAAIAKLDRRRQKWEAKLEGLDENDEAAQERIGTKLDALDTEAEQVQQAGQTHYGEAAKAVGTAFLILDPDGRVRREYRMPRQRHQPGTNGNSPPSRTRRATACSDLNTGCQARHEALRSTRPGG